MDLQPGDSLDPWTLEDITRTHLVRYAGASGDFNPAHHDDTFAQAVGNPSVFAHGMFTAGVLSTYLTRAFGVGSLRSYRAQFRKQVFPGDSLTFTAKVTDRFDCDGETRVELECTVLTQNGDLALRGSATAAIPTPGAVVVETIPRERGLSDELAGQIFDAAMEVFAEKGFARAKVEEVAEAAGLARATIYYHFRTKRDLYVFLLRRGIETMAEHVADAVDGIDDAADALGALIDAHVDFFDQYQAFTQVVLLETWRIDPTADITPASILAPDLEVVAGVLERAAKAGILKRKLDPGVLLSSFFGLIAATAIYTASYREGLPHAVMKSSLREIFLDGVLR